MRRKKEKKNLAKENGGYSPIPTEDTDPGSPPHYGATMSTPASHPHPNSRVNSRASDATILRPPSAVARRSQAPSPSPGGGGGGGGGGRGLAHPLPAAGSGLSL